jgi:FMN reductase
MSPPLKLTIVSGNPKPASRTLQIAQRVADGVFPGQTIEVIELTEHARDLFDWNASSVDELVKRVAASDVVIFATPTYKATYTGLLKAFLDRFQANGLSGVVAFVVMTGADFHHALAPQATLVPLLLELAASVPNRGLFFNTAQIDKADEIVAAYVAEARQGLTRIAGVARA